MCSSDASVIEDKNIKFQFGIVQMSISMYFVGLLPKIENLMGLSESRYPEPLWFISTFHLQSHVHPWMKGTFPNLVWFPLDVLWTLSVQVCSPRWNYPVPIEAWNLCGSGHSSVCTLAAMMVAVRSCVFVGLEMDVSENRVWYPEIAILKATMMISHDISGHHIFKQPKYPTIMMFLSYSRPGRTG